MTADMTDDADLMVHAMIGRLFEEPEPTHRTDLADSAIAHGMAATRRRGFAVAGATLGVLAVVAGAAVVSGGRQGSGDWSLGSDTGQSAPQSYEDSAPNYADRQREIVEQLPGLVNPLLPAGMTMVRDPHLGNDSVSTKTGDYTPGFALHAGNHEFIMRFDSDGAPYTAVFGTALTAPITVAGGSIRVAIQGGGAVEGSGWYEFAPADKAAVPVRFSLAEARSGQGPSPISASAFRKMVEAPGFAKIQQLLDPSAQGSPASVRQRYAIEAKINAEAAKVMPPGFRLKLSPGAPGQIEIVGPRGVDALQWFADAGTQGQINCPADALCYAAESDAHKKVGPDGRARLGIYVGWAGTSPGTSVILQVWGVAGLGSSNGWTVAKRGSETAPRGPGLTPQQAMAIIQAPGVVKVIADVQDLAALK